MHFLSRRNFFTRIFLSTTSLFVLGASPFKTPLPEIVNHTKSLIVERVDEDEAGYHLTIRGSAPVDVFGFALAVIGENGICDSHTLLAFSGPWLSAQETAKIPELQFPSADEGGFGERRGVCSEDGDHKIELTVPSIPVTPRIVIEALVFEDGTYDGDPARAMMMEAERIGRERQFRRIATQVEEELNSSGGRDWIGDLHARVSALTVEPEPEMVHSLQSRFGATGTPEEQVKSDIAGGLGTEKLIVLNNLKIYEMVSSKRGQPIVSLQTWWAATHGQCEFFSPQCANATK
jgi:hypothetical protein